MTDDSSLLMHKTFKYKQTSQFLDPCQEETLASMKCLDENNYDKQKCYRFFLQFRECKKKWLEERRAMRRQGLL